MFVLAALACSKRSVEGDSIKKSDGIGAGRESEQKKIPYFQTRKRLDYLNSLLKKRNNKREPLSLSTTHLFKFSQV